MRSRIGTVLMMAFFASGPPLESDETQPADPTDRDRRELVVAAVGQRPNSAIAEMQVLTDWLEGELMDDGVDEIRIRIAPSVLEVAGWLAEGSADVYVDSPFPVLLARHHSGCQPLVRRWKWGVAEYRSVVFVRADTGVETARQLRGRVLAFEDRYSSSSFILPSLHLMSLDLDLRELDSASGPAGDAVGYVFSGQDRNTLLWVVTGKVDGGAMNERSFETLAAGDRAALRIVETTGMIPRHLVAVRRDLDEDLRRALRSALFSAERSPSGRAMLKAFFETTRFDPVPQAFLDRMDSLQEAVVALEGGHGAAP